MRRGLSKQKCRLNCSDLMSDCRSEAGRLFHTLAPATEKLLSPRMMVVWYTLFFILFYRYEHCNADNFSDKPDFNIV